MELYWLVFVKILCIKQFKNKFPRNKSKEHYTHHATTGVTTPPEYSHTQQEGSKCNTSKVCTHSLTHHATTGVTTPPEYSRTQQEGSKCNTSKVCAHSLTMQPLVWPHPQNTATRSRRGQSAIQVRYVLTHSPCNHWCDHTPRIQLHAAGGVKVQYK